MRKVMIDKIGSAAMYEQLAEECTELAKAALKASRQIRGENPPRMTPKEVWAGLQEEVADVWICLRELDLKIDPEIVKFKEERFLKAWEEVHGDETNKPKRVMVGNGYYIQDSDGRGWTFYEMEVTQDDE